MIEIKFKLLENAGKKLGVLDVQLLKNLNEAIYKAALLVHNTAKKKIQQGSRTGRIYTRGKIRHQASAPGEPPKSDTGRLANSIRVNFLKLAAEVGSDVKYSSILEDKLNRPWLESSYLENKDVIQKMVDEAVQESLNGS